MTGADFLAALPFLVMGGTVIAVTLAIAVHRVAASVATLALTGAVLSLAALWPAQAVVPRQVTALVVIDGYSIFFIGLVLVAAIAVLLLSHGTLARRSDPPEAFHLLLLLATLGAMAVIASSHFASFFLGLETLSISLLGLIAYPHGRERPLEAGIKYLVLGGISSAFLLFGIALVYLRLGSLAFADIAVHRAAMGAEDNVWLVALALIITGIGFKLSIVPFHLWAPDVYEGAPAPVTGFIAVVSKGAVLVLLLRFFLEVDAFASAPTKRMIEVLAFASMLTGNLLALMQTNLKRILAYSSIAHLGYLLLALLAGGALAVEAVAYYFTAYAAMTLGAFGVITLVSERDSSGDVDALAAYRGLIWRRPWLGVSFTMILLSLAGLPPTMGFFAKVYALTAGVNGAQWPAVGALVAGSVIGLFYYLRIIVVMVQAAPDPPAAAAAAAAWPGIATLAALTGVLFGLGLFPMPLLHLIRATATQVLGG
jgi:NADH-quinone oxidoreductase subunit N